jgi:hypothetical protein
MTMDTTLVVGGVLLISAIAVIGFVLYSNRPRRRHRRFVRDGTGNIVALGRDRVGAPIPLQGKGTFSSTPAQLQAGKYVLSYELDTATRVALIAQADGDEETVLISAGAGLKEFAVDAAGAYLWRVEPNIEDSSWRINYRQVQRRGQ